MYTLKDTKNKLKTAHEDFSKTKNVHVQHTTGTPQQMIFKVKNIEYK